MDEICAAAMWQESNVTTNAQRIIARHLSDFFGNRLIVPESCITKLGQNHVPPESKSIILNDEKIHFWTKPLDQLLTRSLLSKYEDITNKETLKSKLSKIDMVIGGDHGQDKFRNVCKYIMRNKDGKNMTSYVIKNGHIDHKKDTYEIFQHTLATPLNNDLKYLRRKDYCLYFKWKEDGKLEVSYEEKDNDSLSNYVSHVSIPLRILISGDLAFFATVVGKKNMSGKWCHWCNLSVAEWEDCDHEKGDMWSIQLMKDNLKEQQINLDMTQNEKKGCVLPMLFDSIPIENYIFSLLHVEIGVGNKILESFYNWITKYIEPLSKEEIEMINNLIDLQIELIENKELLKQINHLNITKIADLTTEQKYI